ncbi:MAG TPA: hypothetical protein RMH99_11000 [Sandaracinaceae bacterium LLY-WYZ-13_1]|nr:hypothetical protein [Sandaracinaceae bacterium LLY-WYZ-13_1]
MRIGLVGPANGDRQVLREALEFVLGDVDVDQAIYLGDDEETVDAVLEAWREELFEGREPEGAFLDRAVELACEGSAEALEGLLTAEETARRLGRVRKMPPPPARAVEMLADRIFLAVHDKSVLDEEDIANSSLIVYGQSAEAQLKRFGPRYFLTPGPLSEDRVAVLELESDGKVSIALYEISGVPVWREKMARRTSKLNVAR